MMKEKSALGVEALSAKGLRAPNGKRGKQVKIEGCRISRLDKVVDSTEWERERVDRNQTLCFCSREGMKRSCYFFSIVMNSTWFYFFFAFDSWCLSLSPTFSSTEKLTFQWFSRVQIFRCFNMIITLMQYLFSFIFLRKQKYKMEIVQKKEVIVVKYNKMLFDGFFSHFSFDTLPLFLVPTSLLPSSIPFLYHSFFLPQSKHVVRFLISRPFAILCIDSDHHSHKKKWKVTITCSQVKVKVTQS